MNNKLLLGGLAAAVTSFLLGWVIYDGMGLMNYMQENGMKDFYRGKEEMMSYMWAMVAANLVMGLGNSLVIGKWAGSRTLVSGMMNGAIMGLIFCVSYDLGFWAYSNLFSSMTPMLVDLLAGTAMSAITGGVVGWVWGMGKAAE